MQLFSYKIFIKLNTIKTESCQTHIAPASIILFFILIIIAQTHKGEREKKMEIGFLGLGIMGKAMSMNLLKHGFKLTVWNRTLSKVIKKKHFSSDLIKLF